MDLDSCLAALKSPGVVAFPTDTFFALSCDPLQPDALAQLRTLKDLAPDRPLPLLIPQGFDVTTVGASMPAAGVQLADMFWPGKLTLIVPCGGPLSEAVGRGSDGAVGFRVPGGQWLLQLLDRMQSPLVGTSANPTGQPPAQRASEVRAYFGEQVSWVGDEDAEGGAPSTVVDVTCVRPEIVRSGAIDTETILERLAAERLS